MRRDQVCIATWAIEASRHHQHDYEQQLQADKAVGRGSGDEDWLGEGEQPGQARPRLACSAPKRRSWRPQAAAVAPSSGGRRNTRAAAWHGDGAEPGGPLPIWAERNCNHQLIPKEPITLNRPGNLSTSWEDYTVKSVPNDARQCWKCD